MPDNESFYKIGNHNFFEPGYEIRINRTIMFEPGKADLSTYAGLPVEELQAMLKDSAAAERGFFASLQQTAQEWEKYSAKTLLLEKAIEVARVPAVRHTSNQWQKSEDGSGSKISNMVYSMTYALKEITKYDPATEQRLSNGYSVTWSVTALGTAQSRYGVQIAGQNKSFLDKAAAEKYLQGRIKTYAHLFTELSPPIPPEHAQHFIVNGQLLPGYTLQGQEPQQSHAAAEISEGGASASGREKQSVLGKLSASKAEGKEVPAVLPKKERGPEL
nr:hypothetical protein [uncultured Eisenbergiella sp.]